MSITEYDWVKPPHYRSAWYTYHHENLLRYSLNYSDHVNGYIPQTINLTVVNENDDFDSNNIQLDISPQCSSTDEHGIYLTKLQIQKLNLMPIEMKKTKLYGLIQTYSGIKLRITSPKCYQYTYYIPSSFVYELPNIFSSARLIPEMKELGIPQRQGIIHRELFYHHALISYNGILYGLTDELFHMSGIPEIISKHPICEITKLLPHSIRSHVFNLNSLFRPLIYPLHSVHHDNFEESEVPIHPSLLEDHIEASLPTSPVYLCLKKALQCYYCQRFHLSFSPMIYCPLCRLRHVQSPHIYCSKRCQISHRQEHLSYYHDTSQTEAMIIEPSDLSLPASASRTLLSQLPQYPNSDHTRVDTSLRKKKIQTQQAEMIKFEKYLQQTSSAATGSGDQERRRYWRRHGERREEGDSEEDDEGASQHSEGGTGKEEETEGDRGKEIDWKRQRKLQQREQYEKYLASVESEFQREELPLLSGVRCDRVEVWIIGFLCFYLLCYALLRSGDREDYLLPQEHDEM
jgi:hypothetical protein